ncbi:hypothetical protein HRbin12_01327 [bacterium HR12]|nr:hypothetical protein HRbin12_01327 [bacterium HR12]
MELRYRGPNVEGYTRDLGIVAEWDDLGEAREQAVRRELLSIARVYGADPRVVLEDYRAVREAR